MFCWRVLVSNFSMSVHVTDLWWQLANHLHSLTLRRRKEKIYKMVKEQEKSNGLRIFFGVFTEKDSTDDFEDAGHSDSAKELMQNYYIGEVDVSTLPPKPIYRSPPPTQAHAVSSESSGLLVKILQYLLPLLILGFAFALPYHGQKGKLD